MKKTWRNFTIGTFASTALVSTALFGLAMAPVMVPVMANARDNDHHNEDQVVQAPQAGKADPKLQLSQDGYNVMRDIRAARVAIFNGDTVAAVNFVDMAKKAIAATEAEDTIVRAKDKDDAGRWVPIDGQLVVADNFVATPEKTEHIAAGNQKIKEGKTREAIEELKLADVDIGFTRLLMPLSETEAHVNTAAKLIASEDYFQANMALKAAEDGVNVDTVMLVGAPKADDQKVSANDQKPAEMLPHKEAEKGVTN